MSDDYGDGPTPGKPTKRSSSTKPKRSAGRPTNRETRAKRVAAFYRVLAGAAGMASILDRRLAIVGGALDEHADALGDAWAEWAETSPRVAGFIDRAVPIGGAAGVLIAHGALVKAIATEGLAAELGVPPEQVQSLFDQIRGAAGGNSPPAA